MRSSRKLAQAIVENVPCRVLAHNTTPRYLALNRFGTRHHAALGNLLVPSIALAADLRLGKLGSVAVDGTKINANASKRKAMSYARLEAREAKVREQVEAYVRSVDVRSVDAHDVNDERTLGLDDDGVSVPPNRRDAEVRPPGDRLGDA